MSDRFFMTTPEECCAFYFNDDPCTVINVCGATTAQPKASEAPSKRPTARPTRVPGDIPPSYKNDGCHPDRKWHADTTLGKEEAGCTNNDVFPPGWDQPPMVDRMFFGDAKSCCDYFFVGRNDCEWIDVCAAIDAANNNDGGGTTSSPTVGGLTSSPISDDESDSEAPTYYPSYIPTVAPVQEEEPSYTYPPDNPCHLRKWHPNTSSLENTCTNDLIYPPSWDNGIMMGITMFATPQDCCEKLIKTNGGSNCEIVEDTVCNPVVETVSPTVGPTKVETVSPTKVETASLTKHPVIDDSGGDDSGDENGYECSDKWHPDEGE